MPYVSNGSLSEQVKEWLQQLSERVNQKLGSTPHLYSIHIANTYEFQDSSCYYQYYEGALMKEKGYLTSQ